MLQDTENSILFTQTKNSKRLHRKDVQFHRRDWLALLGTFICTAAYAFGHSSLFSDDYRGLPGIGLTLSCFFLLTVCIAYMGRTTLKWTRQNIFLLISTLLLSATYGIFDNSALRQMNLPVLLTLSLLTLHTLRGTISLKEMSALANCLRRSFRSLKQYFPVPIYGLWNCTAGKGSKRLKEMLLGLLICIPVIAILLLLFSNADSIFGDILHQLENWFYSPNIAMAIWNIIRMLILTLILFALIFGLTHSFSESKAKTISPTLPKLSAAIVLTAICLLYAAFIYVQIRFLFAGKALLGSEYAAYARRGFFELVAVSAFTLMIVLYALRRYPRCLYIRVECGAIALLTMTIVFSALWRMRLYILEYGFTFLRAVTLWGILAISVAMLAAFAKAIHPGLSIFKPLLIFTICTWLIFNYSNVNARIAEYNIHAYRMGKTEALDVYYLEQLGIDAIEPIEALLNENILPTELQNELYSAHWRVIRNVPNAYDWCLNWNKVN